MDTEKVINDIENNIRLIENSTKQSDLDYFMGSAYGRLFALKDLSLITAENAKKLIDKIEKAVSRKLRTWGRR